MSFLDIDTSNAVEPKAVPAGKEYKLRIVGYLTKEDEVTNEEQYIWPNQNGDPCFMPIFEIPAEPTSKEIRHYMAVPTEDMNAKDQNQRAWNIEAYKRAFNIPKGKVNLKKTIGLQGWAILGLQEDDQYGKQNNIKEFILPK